MKVLDMYTKYHDEIMNNKAKYKKDYKKVYEEVEKSTAIYKGKPVKFVYQPMLYFKEDIKRFNYIVETMSQILNKVIGEYKNNSDFRKLFGFSRELEELIMIDSGYDDNFPIARFDIFYPYNDDYKFCEINSDGTSSMNEVRELYRIFSQSLTASVLGRDIYDFELIDKWIDKLIDIYGEFTGDVDIPTIAIADFKGDGIISEFEVIKQFMSRRGLKAVICDPRDLEYKNGKLRLGNLIIDLVYRRATTRRMVDELEDIQDLVNAYKDSAVCMIGGFVSQLIHNKQLFCILHMYDKLQFLNDYEIDFIKKHVPFTFYLTTNNNKIINEKDTYIIKPYDSYAAKGVYVGKDYSRKEWEDIISEVSNYEYIAQEYCHVPRIKTVSAENDFTLEEYNYLTGLYVYRGEFSGIYSRAGRRSIIASVAESFTLPNFCIK